MEVREGSGGEVGVGSSYGPLRSPAHHIAATTSARPLWRWS